MKLTHAQIRAELNRISDQMVELELRQINLWALDYRLARQGGGVRKYD